MALGKQQSRPVNPNDDFGFSVLAYTGAIVTTDAFALNTLVGLLNTAETLSAVVDAGANAATFDITSDGLDAGLGSLTITLVSGDTGYAIGDAVSLPLSGFTNVTGGTVDATVVSVTADTVTFDTIVGTGTVGFQALDVIQANELSGGSGTGLSVKVSTVDGNGLPTAFTVEAFGDGLYETADALTYIGSGEVGISDSSKYYDHDQYELGGQIDEYKTGNGLTVTITVAGDALASVTTLDGGVNYRVGDVVELGNNTNLTSAGIGSAQVDTVDEFGAVTGTLTIVTAGAGFVAGNENTAFVSRKLNQTATGEYAGLNADNDPTISVGRLPDGEQLIVQQRDIDGGAVTVFAEPTTVNSYGDVVGNIIRAEDITDQYRCVAVYLSDGATSRFEWVTSATGDAAQEGYGYCREIAGGDVAGALEDADCPAGWEWDAGTGCQVRALADVNADEVLYAADSATGINPKVAAQQCFAGGNWFEPNAVVGFRCIDGTNPDLFSYTNASYALVDVDGNAVTTNSSAQDYAAVVCQQMDFDWSGAPAYTCQAKVDVTGLTTQADCADAGHVWVAGTCYNKADFGDGYSRQGNEGDTKNKIPK